MAWLYFAPSDTLPLVGLAFVVEALTAVQYMCMASRGVQLQ
jgi:hypothetical protein